ncbi:MAG: primosomal protein N', partial [Simkaniaceae bacterium]|nr:primosomal protein N' [Simkaniaceae bacterium]
MSDTIAIVVLDDGINKSLDYQIPDDLLENVFTGTRVLVPVGKTIRKGTVQGKKATSPFAKLAQIKELLEDRPVLSQSLMHLAEWMARYYATPLRRVMRSFIPAPIRDGHKAKEQLIVKRIASPKLLLSYINQWREKYPARTTVLEAMLKKPGGILLTELLEETKTSKSPVETLAKEGLLHLEKITIDRAAHNENEYFRTTKKTLTDEQQVALTAILETMGKKYATHLLYGITGSGKTEVYLQAIDIARSRNEGVIMLVPEIALTTQTTERLRARFGEKIAILHHRLSDGERRDLFHQIQNGDINIVVGARSAIFTPIKNLKLIIVDEEHDASFKQSDEMPCYHAREIAIYRAHLEKATVVLGSATPSLESFYNAEIGKFNLLKLTKRADSASMPKVHLIDLKLEREKGSTLLSEPLLSAIKDRTAKGEQTLLFLNRRGYHAFLLCTS